MDLADFPILPALAKLLGVGADALPDQVSTPMVGAELDAARNDLASANTRIAAAEAKLAELETRICPEKKSHWRDELAAARDAREVATDRIGVLETAHAEATAREGREALEARLAEAPTIAKRADKRLARIDEASRALAALLAEQAADEFEYVSLVAEARAIGRELPDLYASRNIPAVIEPARTISEKKWQISRAVNVGTVMAPVWANRWVDSGVLRANGKGAMVPTEADAQFRTVERVIPEQIIKWAEFFTSPTVTTVIPGFWPKP